MSALTGPSSALDPAAQIADLVTTGLVANARLATAFNRGVCGDTPLQDVVQAMQRHAEAVHQGDLRTPETLLTSQAVALNGMFIEFARRAHGVLANGGRFEQVDHYMRWALRAQSQSRAALEAIGTLKNPTVFARQANVSAGPQQINNHATVAVTRAAGERTLAPRELFRVEGDGGRLDRDATTAARGGDSSVATVGALDRPADAGREGAIVSECLPRRTARSAARRGAGTPGAAACVGGPARGGSGSVRGADVVIAPADLVEAT